MKAAGKSHFAARGRVISVMIIVLAGAIALYTMHESYVRPTSSDSSIDADVVHVHATVVLAVEPAHVRSRPVRLQHHRDAVQLLMPRVKHVSRHRRLAQTVAAQWRSNAAVRSTAIDCGERPSIWCRCTKCTTSPSRSSAIDGLLG